MCGGEGEEEEEGRSRIYMEKGNRAHRLAKQKRGAVVAPNQKRQKRECDSRDKAERPPV